MGTKQKKCPRCKRKRRFVEGGDPYERARRTAAWTKTNGQWTCNYCIAKGNTIAPAHSA